VLIVDTDLVEVDRLLSEGVLGCPGCSGVLRPWGHGRERGVRAEPTADARAAVRVRPRRSRCSSCGSTHVLVPAWMLVRRADAAAVIGAALVAKAAGAGHRRIAVSLGRADSTVRGWLRRFAQRAESIRVLFTGLLHGLDASAEPVAVTASVFADALEVIGRAAAAASRLLGPRPPWEFTSAASAGLLLGPHR